VYVRSTLPTTVWTYTEDDLTYELLWVRNGATFLGALYHPPRPQYQTESLLDYIEASINELNTLHPAAFIALAGDFNQLTDNVITERTGLVQIVHQPTRGHNKLDRIFVSNLAYSIVRAVTSVVKSDHLAVISSSDTTKGTMTKTKSQHKYRPKTAINMHGSWTISLRQISASCRQTQ